MAQRETKSIWFYLFGRYPNGEWRGWSLLKRRWWRGPHIWHDTVGRYWHQLVSCRFFGHRRAIAIGNGVRHCFACERPIEEE